MKNYVLIFILVFALMLTSCSVSVNDEGVETEETTEASYYEVPPVSLETYPVLSLDTIFSNVNYITCVPEIIDGTGNTKTIHFFRDGEMIEGRITIPEGEGPFRTIVISAGLYAQLGRYSSKAKNYSKKGYAVIEFDFLNCTPPPDYSDPEYIGDYIFEEIKDLNAVLDSLQYIPEVDIANVYLYGHSMGGLVASYVGTQRQEELRGLILVDPSFYATALMEFEYEETITTDIDKVIAFCGLPVILITGTAGSFGEDPDFFNDELEAFPDCEYIVIDGADHHMDGEAGKQVVEESVRVMESWGYALRRRH